MNSSTSPSRRRPTGAGAGSASLFRMGVVAAPYRTALLIIGAAAIATAVAGYIYV